MDTVTAILPDTRTVTLDEEALFEWGELANDGDTQLGLAEWAVIEGHDISIEGKADPDPLCDHYDPSPGHDFAAVANGAKSRSVLTCTDRACILDAMAWVERAGQGPATAHVSTGAVYSLTDGEG